MTKSDLSQKLAALAATLMVTTLFLAGAVAPAVSAPTSPLTHIVA